jgi:hypothetical protein
MGKTITKKYLEDELADMIESNEAIKAGARMVGFDMDGQTDEVLAKLDQRVRVNIHQRGRINTLKSLLEDLEQA